MAAPLDGMPHGGGGPPFAKEQLPLPGRRVGLGCGGVLGGGGSEMVQGYGAPDTGMPPQAYTFDVNPMPPTAAPAEEAVSASVAAVPQEGAPAEVPADMAATPAVDALATQSTTVETHAAESSAEPITESEVTTSEVITSEVTTGETSVEPAATATPSEVAIVASEGITSSTIVQNVPADERGEAAIAVTGPARNLPVLWVAQGSTIFLTIVLASLWWRSRTSRRRDQ
jgi:hypothetical protein